MDSEFSGGHRTALVLAVVFLFIMLGAAIDIVLDRPMRLISFHSGIELLIVLLSLGAAAYLAWGWYSAQSRLVESVQESDRLSRERQEWEDRVADLMEGLGSAISDQFEAWALTPTQRKVALMLLQGLSHRHIALNTQTSVRTVETHSLTVYKKSGLAGRAELAGFFLENLHLPEDLRQPESA